MRWQSSAIRIAYNMLASARKHSCECKLKQNKQGKEIYEKLRRLFPLLPTRYIPSAIIKASQYPKDRPLVFGGKTLFEKLCKNHLLASSRMRPCGCKQGKQREKLKQKWKERRQGTLISIGTGNGIEKGNRLLRFEKLNDELNLRITTGKREFIYAKVLREPSNERDKWNTFLRLLYQGWKTKEYFSYTVELKLRDGEIYGGVSFEYPEPEVWLTREYGVIGIDTNASPMHLAIAEVSSNGNLISYQSISLHELIGLSKNKKKYQEWLIAHKVIKIAKEKGKAIAIEELNKVKKGYRGDGKAKLRKRLHNWNFKSLLLKIERLAKLNGIEVIKVNPAYTSIIGSLKYAPQFGLNKDIASAYVIGRRSLGFKEKAPKNYLKLLSDKEYIEYALCSYEEKEELKEKLEKETNQYKQNAIKSELKEVSQAKVMILRRFQSLQSEPGRGKGADGRNSDSRYDVWRVLKVAFLFPVLGGSFTRDFSPLKRMLVQGM